jgi:hypothetical protein
MAKFSLATYAIRVEDLERRRGAYCHLDDIAGNDFLKIIEAFLAESSGFSLSNRAERKLIRVRRCNLRDRTLDGTIETGDYGYEAELVDSQTQEVAHRQQTTEAQMLPFYFLADLPTQRDEGTLILQRFHQYGIRQLLVKPLEEWFKDRYTGYRLFVRPFMPRDAWEPFLTRGRITQLRFVKRELPQDLADLVDEGHREVTGSAELVIKAKRNGSLPIAGKLREVFDGRQGSILELENFPYDTTKVEIVLGNSQRTIDLGNIYGARGYFDISDDVELGSDGYPTMESISRIARLLARSYVP